MLVRRFGRRVSHRDFKVFQKRGEKAVLLNARLQREDELAVLLHARSRPNEHAVRMLRVALYRRVLRVTPVSYCYAERCIVQQNLLAALRRPLFVGVFPDAVPVDHYEHVHPLLEQTALVVLQLERLLPCVHIRVQILGLSWVWVGI